MKGTRTLRGKVEANQGVRRLIMDDGDATHAYRVTGFNILGADPASDADCIGTLAISEGGARTWDLGDNRQIGWAGMAFTGSNTPHNVMSVVDPDHIVVRDLYVYGEGTGSTPGYQYMVTVERVDISEERAVLALIKERSQDDL